jgi:UDP-glucose 4-epimerase
MATYIITGATSMIGISLCHHISLQSGNMVYAICRRESNGLNKLPTNHQIKIILSDLANLANVEREIDQADIFINLAWTNTDHQGRNDVFLQGLNVSYAMDAIRIAKKLGCKLFVQAGSQAEYGIVNGIITEDTPCNPEVEYGKAKLRVLNEGSALCQILGLTYLHLRIFSVFGENDRPWTLIMSAIDKLLKNEVLHLSACTQNWNYLYARDCARQIVLLCTLIFNKPFITSDVYHIASRNTRPLKDFLEEMKSIINSSGKLLYGSMIPAKIISIHPSIEKTESVIGFTNEISFSDAIKQIVSINYGTSL